MSIAVNAHPATGIALSRLNAAPVTSPVPNLKAASPRAIPVPTPGTNFPALPSILVDLVDPLTNASAPAFVPALEAIASAASVPNFPDFWAKSVLSADA